MCTLELVSWGTSAAVEHAFSLQLVHPACHPISSLTHSTPNLLIWSRRGTISYARCREPLHSVA